MSLRHGAHRRKKIKEVQAQQAALRDCGRAVPGECATCLSKLFIFKNHPFFLAFFSYVFFSLCTYNILNSASIILHAAGPVLSWGTVWIPGQDPWAKEIWSRMFFFYEFQVWRKSSPDISLLLRSQWKPGSSVAFWKLRCHWGEGWAAPTEWVEMRWGPSSELQGQLGRHVGELTGGGAESGGR